MTEIRAGVYMFGDLFQAEIETHGADAIAVTVLTSVIGRRPGRILVDAGGLALSKDRSTQEAPARFRLWPGARYRRDAPTSATPSCAAPIRSMASSNLIRRIRSICRSAAKLRIAPNHVCMTAAAHDRYFVVDGEQDVAAIWHRVNGW